jgi:molybdopterin-guanine dinucleotide biosynthesis adapter protein
MRSMSISRVRIPICIVRLVLARRFALMHELREAAEPRLAVLLGCMAPVDLILVKSYKRDTHAKIEVHRLGNTKPFVYPEDATFAALATDATEGLPSHLPCVS